MTADVCIFVEKAGCYVKGDLIVLVRRCSSCVVILILIIVVS